MAERLKLSDQELKPTMLMDVMENMGNMQEQMGDVSREIETLRKIHKKMLEIKKPL